MLADGATGTCTLGGGAAATCVGAIAVGAVDPEAV